MTFVAHGAITFRRNGPQHAVRIFIEADGAVLRIRRAVNTRGIVVDNGQTVGFIYLVHGARLVAPEEKADA